MDNKQKSALAIAIAAGVSGMTVADDASAATYSATLTAIATYSNNGTAGSPLNINSSTGLTWSYDDVTNLMTQTGGTINARATTAACASMTPDTLAPMMASRPIIRRACGTGMSSEPR